MSFIRRNKFKFFAIFSLFFIIDVGSRYSFRRGQPPDISGEYIFKKENCSQGIGGCFLGVDPDFGISSLGYQVGEVPVSVRKIPDGFVIEHNRKDHMSLQTVISNKNWSVGWDSDKIVYRWAKWLVSPMGVIRESRFLRLYLDQNQSLIIKTRFSKGGVALFFGLFTESIDNEMKLVRVKMKSNNIEK